VHEASAAADPPVAEVTEMLYMTERPAVLDRAETRRLLGVIGAGKLPSATDDSCGET
jgi:hypothetical protein